MLIDFGIVERGGSYNNIYGKIAEVCNCAVDACVIVEEPIAGFVI